jgi:hypothetical protein
LAKFGNWRPKKNPSATSKKGFFLKTFKKIRHIS